MRLSSGTRLVIVILVLTLALVGMVGRKQWTLATGVPVVLETQPVDPRSLFRGDYVRLNYKISSFDLSEYPALAGVERGDEVYVALHKQAPYWQPVSVSRVFPTGEPVVIRGRVDRIMTATWNPQTRKYEQDRQVLVKYGIENYFLPEGEGRAIERPAAGERISIEVAVDARGNAGIRAVLVNGKPRYVESLF